MLSHMRLRSMPMYGESTTHEQTTVSRHCTAPSLEPQWIHQQQACTSEHMERRLHHAVSCHNLSACCFPGRCRVDYVVPCNYRHSATRHKDATLGYVGLPLNSGNHGPTSGAQELNHKVGTTSWERTVRSHRVVPTLRFRIRAQMQARLCGPVYGAAQAGFMKRCSASICPHAVF